MTIKEQRPVRRWILRGSGSSSDDEQAGVRLAQTLGVTSGIGQLLIKRGITDPIAADQFLHPAIDQLHDPLLMHGMDKAVTRILQAVDNDEPILIYGDYDVDGTTGTVVLRRALQLLGAATHFHVPHRFTEGYGIRQEVLERAHSNGCKLVVSVDCGIRAHQPLAWARDNGLDCIVTDHHLPDESEGAPPAYAVLNPNQSQCIYPDKNLAGVGVAFKLVQALLGERGRQNLIGGFLKMVAIGTVADVAPLVGENRTIVALGLADLPKATNPGLLALMRVAGCIGKEGDGVSGKRAGQQAPLLLRAYDIGFRLGPRINAAGRMDAARLVIELFETTDCAEAERLAATLDNHNRERQTMQQAITESALIEMEANVADAKARVVVVAGDDWHRGVIGLAASKISERTSRPCIVISLDKDGIGHGSARSIEAYHLLDGLTSCGDLFERFGGHAHAAGLVIQREHIPELRRRLNDHAADRLCDEDFVLPLRIDAELPAAALTLKLTEELQQLEPFGAGWPRPVFVTKNLFVRETPRILKGRHLKLQLADKEGRRLEAIWWGAAEAASPQAGDCIEAVYSVEPNTWQGETRLQLVMQDWRPCLV